VKNKMKKLIVIVATLALALYMAPAAHAATVRNRNTGSGSTNTVSRSDTRTYGESVDKRGGALNLDVALVDTGNNVSDKNTGGTNKVSSGKTTATVGTDDVVNLSTLHVTQADDTEGDVVENNTTGADSHNTATITRTRTASYSEVSRGAVLNVSLVVANTGDNSSSKNTGGANTVDAGDAIVTMTHASDVNGSDVIINQ
jgi:hypothetical protein